MRFNTALAGLFDMAREGESHYSSLYLPGNGNHNHTINLGPFGGPNDHDMGIVSPAGWQIEHLEDGSTVYFSPPDTAPTARPDTYLADYFQKSLAEVEAWDERERHLRMKFVLAENAVPVSQLDWSTIKIE